MLSDVNGDGLQDIVGFGSSGVVVALSTGSNFAPPATWRPNQYAAGGWVNNSVHPRTLADVNGDGLPDIVGFADSGVFVSPSTGTTFTPQALWLGQFGRVAGGWSNNNVYPRVLADVNGDGFQDIVGFASSGVVVSLSTGSSFLPHTMWLSGQFVTNSGWSNNETYPRVLADVNGDGLADIVGFANAGVYVSLSTGSNFIPHTAWLSGQFGKTANDWTNSDSHPRKLIDVNADGLADIVGFGNDGVYVSLSTGSSFTPQALWHADFGYNDGWTSDYTKPRMVDDINGDGLPDVLGLKGSGSYSLFFALAKGPLPDLLTSITDSLGRVSTIGYAPLTDGAVYSKDSDAVFPVVDVQAPLYVVKSVSADDGVGGQKVTSYTYAGAKAHVQGRGFRGFRQMTATDEQTGIVTTTTYSQVFPTTAQVLNSTKTLSDGTTLKTLANTWDELSLNGGASVWPYVASSVSEDYEPNDGPGNLPVVSRSAVAAFDGYGNPTTLTTTTSGGGETFTETTLNTYANDTTNWHLGLVTRSEVSRTRPGAP